MPSVEQLFCYLLQGVCQFLADTTLNTDGKVPAFKRVSGLVSGREKCRNPLVKMRAANSSEQGKRRVLGVCTTHIKVESEILSY